MPSARVVRSLGVERLGKMYFHHYEEGPLENGRFRVNTLFTGFSAGTELTFVKGSNPYLSARWDEQLCAFSPDEPGTRYPLPFLGYMEVARVSGSRTSVVSEGELVAMTYGHKTGHTADPRHEFFVPLPHDFDPVLGIFVAQMGPICANGLLHAAAELVGVDVRSLGDGVSGRNVLVIGAGMIGLLTALFSRRCGASGILVADPSPFRRERAQALGFAAADEAQAWRQCKERWSHGGQERGADIAFQCRARSASLHSALRALRPQGSVIDLAFYQDGANELRLGEEFHHNGLSIRSAQIGRVPRGLAFAWSRHRLALETIALLRANGQLVRDYLITHLMPLEEAPALIADLLAHRRDFLQIVFRIGA
jgi:Zinc-binding dehydrogenase